MSDPIALLRKHYTLEQVQQVCERFNPDVRVGLCLYFAEARDDASELRYVPRYGLSQMRRTSFFDLPAVLEAFGGDLIGNGSEYFWPIAMADPLTHTPVVDPAGQRERLMMLAFMLTWLEDV